MRKINKKINVTLIFTLIGVCLSADLAYSKNNSSLRVPLITKDERILSAHRAIIENRLNMLDAGKLISAIGRAPEKYSFIINDPFLNDEEFWGDAEKVQEILKTGSRLENLVGSERDLKPYFEELDQSLPHIVDVVVSLLREQKYLDRKFVCLGRAADFIYWTMNYFLGDISKTQSHLIDISHKAPDSRPLIKANREAFKNFLIGLGLKEDDRILVVDEFSSGNFPEEVSFMFQNMGYTDVMGIDLCHRYAENVKGKGWKSTYIPGSIWGFNNGSNRPAVDAMNFLGTGYVSGRSYEVSAEDGKWVYKYKDSDYGGFGPSIKKNGKYWNWLNRKRLYDYLLDKESELDNAVLEIRELHNKNLPERNNNWFAGRWWDHVEFEYLYYHPRYFQVYYERLMQGIPGDTKVFESKHTVIIHATKNLPPELITPIKDTLLEYTDRVYCDSMVYKVINTCNLTTVNGEPFMLVTLGYKMHYRLGYWKELQSEELKRVSEIMLLVDPEKNVVISGLNLSFEYEGNPQKIPYVRISGLGRASCPVNSSLAVHEDYRNRFFGPTIIALGIKRACEILGNNSKGVIGEDIDSGSRSSPLGRTFDNMGFSFKYPFGHGGKGVRLDELNIASIFRVLPRSYEGPAMDMTKLAGRTAL